MRNVGFRPAAVGDEGFFPVDQQAHPAAAFARQEGGNHLHIQRLGAASETACHMGLDHADFALVHLQHLGQHQVDVVGHLGRAPAGQPVAQGIVFHHRAVHLHLRLAGFGRVEAFLDHRIGVLEGLVHVAQLKEDIPLQVAFLVVVQQDGAVLLGVPAGEIGRQLLDPDLDLLEGGFGDVNVIGGDGGNRLALVADPFPRQRIFRACDRQHAVGFVGVGAGRHRANAGHGLGI